MRLFYKILLNLCALVSFLVIFYVLQETSSNNLAIISSSKNDKQIKRINNSTDSHFVYLLNTSSVKIENNEEANNIWCIFCKATQTSSIRHKFSVFSHSLISLSTVPLTINVITDNSSQAIAEEVLDNVHNLTGKDFKVDFGVDDYVCEIVIVYTPSFFFRFIFMMLKN